MLRLNLAADAERLRLSVGAPGAATAWRVWRDDEAARILDRSLAGWRELGSFSLEGGRVVRRVFLAATALALAREDGDRPRGGGR